MFSRVLSLARRGIIPVAAVERQTHFVLNPAVAYHGDIDGIRNFGDRVEISAGGLPAQRHGSRLFRHWPDWRDHPGGGIAQAAAGHLDRLASGFSEGRDAISRAAFDLLADVPIGQRY